MIGAPNLPPMNKHNFNPATLWCLQNSDLLDGNHLFRLTCVSLCKGCQHRLVSCGSNTLMGRWCEGRPREKASFSAHLAVTLSQILFFWWQQTSSFISRLNGCLHLHRPSPNSTFYLVDGSIKARFAIFNEPRKFTFRYELLGIYCTPHLKWVIIAPLCNCVVNFDTNKPLLLSRCSDSVLRPQSHAECKANIA